MGLLVCIGQDKDPKIFPFRPATYTTSGLLHPKYLEQADFQWSSLPEGEALRSKNSQAASVDVTTTVPLALLKWVNVVTLPHIDSADIEARKEMAQISAHNIPVRVKKW